MMTPRAPPVVVASNNGNQFKNGRRYICVGSASMITGGRRPRRAHRRVIVGARSA
jgi:hypothetical protein